MFMVLTLGPYKGKALKHIKTWGLFYCLYINGLCHFLAPVLMIPLATIQVVTLENEYPNEYLIFHWYSWWNQMLSLNY